MNRPYHKGHSLYFFLSVAKKVADNTPNPRSALLIGSGITTPRTPRICGIAAINPLTVVRQSSVIAFFALFAIFVTSFTSF